MLFKEEDEDGERRDDTDEVRIESSTTPSTRPPRGRVLRVGRLQEQPAQGGAVSGEARRRGYIRHV